MSEEGSEGSPLRPKRKIRRVLILSSASGSDSDDSVGPTRIIKKRPRVMSEDDESDSSDSSVVLAGVRRRGALPSLRDSDAEVESCQRDPQRPVEKRVSGFSSDSSDGNSEKCSICLLRFKEQEVGTPSSCEHTFCLDCITEWSKNVNTCPVDRLNFDNIVVRSRAGGRVIRVSPVETRPPSVDLLVVEDPTHCEICGSAESEATMLLCDGCDLGYHMQCLTPPLQQIPLEQWFCPHCVGDDIDNFIYLSEVDDLLAEFQEEDRPNGPRPSRLRESRNVRRSARNTPSTEEPSTSSSTSTSTAGTGGRSRAASGGAAPAGGQRGRHKRRRRTKRVLVEYEVEGEGGGKFPVTRRVTVKRRVKRRKAKKRRPRTAARRSHVRASVRARLASLAAAPAAGPAPAAARRALAVAPLSLFGDPHQLEFFSDDEQDAPAAAGGAVVAAAARSTSRILAAYRQARRKMISIPSPPRAAAPPDLLTSILESQTLLHSKNSAAGRRRAAAEGADGRVDVTKPVDSGRKAPSYPGQSRGGGWGGGYRGDYARDQRPLDRNGLYEDGHGGHRARPADQYRGGAWRDDADSHATYGQRPNQYSDDDFDRMNAPRRPGGNRGAGEPPRYAGHGRGGYGPSWQPYAAEHPAAVRRDRPRPQGRHTFGGFENPLDMRVGHEPVDDRPPRNSAESYRATDVAPRDKTTQSNYRPLPEPPTFRFEKLTETEKSEDERSDSGLIIDTEKYDPTEPTHDDSSGEDNKEKPTTSAGPQQTIHNILAGIDTRSLKVPSTVLDNAVKQVLQEHRQLIVPNKVPLIDKSDDDSDGDCPNFSIYSATSVHIANNSSSLISTPITEHKTVASYPIEEDLVQEDDEPPLPEEEENKVSEESKIKVTTKDPYNVSTVASVKTSLDYSDKISKRCPITPNKRDPIKIKLNTPTLIKRQVSLYDAEDVEDENEVISSNLDVNISQSNNIMEIPENVLDSTSEQSDLVTDKIQDENKAVHENDPKNSRVENVETEDISQTSISEANQVNDSTITNDVYLSNEEEIIDNDKDSEKKDDISITGDEEQMEISPEDEINSEQDNDDISENELELNSQDSKKDSTERNDEAIEKMTESISETEDERSYTPCLDENKSKDTSLETEKENIGIEGLDTEMISEEEGNEIFSDADKAESDKSHESPRKEPGIGDQEEGEILEKRKELADINNQEEVKRKKKKDSKKEGKDKPKGKPKKSSEITFKKLSKSGKERNYRDKDERSKKKDRHSSSEREKDKARKKERRKDLERYDVRTVVTEKRRKLKDAFGRDISPGRNTKSPSIPHSPQRRSLSRGRRSLFKERSQSRGRGSPARGRSGSRFKSMSPLSSPRNGSPARAYPAPNRPSPAERRRRLFSRRSVSRGRKSGSRSPSPKASPARRSLSRRPSPSRRKRKSLSPKAKRSPSRGRKAKRSPSPRKKTVSPRRRRSTSRGRKRTKRTASRSPKSKPTKKKKRSRSRALSHSKDKRSRRPRRKSKSPRRKSPKQKKIRKKSVSPELELSPEHARPGPWPQEKSPLYRHWSHSDRSINSRLLSPGWTPPRGSDPEPRHLRVVLPNDDRPRKKERKKRQRELERTRHKHGKDPAGPCKEVFTSGNNILVSVSFNNNEGDEVADDAGERRRRRDEAKRERRERRRRRPGPPADAENAKPIAIIDLERSPFRELTPSPKNVIVLSDSDHGDGEPRPPAEPAPAAAAAPAPAPPAAGPKTPPSPAAAPPHAAAAVKFSIAAKPPAALRAHNPLRDEEPAAEPEGSPAARPEAAPEPAAPPRAASPPSPPSAGSPPSPSPPSSRDAYDPFEPTKSPEAALTAITLETAQRTNLSADDVVNQRPVSPMEKVLALLQSTRDVSPARPAPREDAPAPPEPAAPSAAAPAPAPAAAEPPAASPPRPPAAGRARREGDSPYSPGSSDFGDLFSPPPAQPEPFEALFGPRAAPAAAARARRPGPRPHGRRRGKTQVGVKLDEDNLKILDDLPSSAVEMQVKNKFLKKLNRQERVVEEVKLVLKPHYNKKRLSKEDYKDILRRAVPKICHNKSGEINPAKIQALVEAYVRKFRKRHKLGLV